MEYPGGLIKLGNRGASVKAIQERLGVEPTGVFGPTTAEFVGRFQQTHGLLVDGEVGPKTWAALFLPETGRTVDLGETALLIAYGYVGRREEPRGSNRGPFVDLVNREIGVPLGSYWCMSFVQHCVKEAAARLATRAPLKRTASCSQLYAWAKPAGRLVARPEAGDIFLCRGGELGHYHTGFVAGEIADERFPTVEGNSNDDGSANGVEVAFRSRGRRVSSCDFVRL